MTVFQEVRIPRAIGLNFEMEFDEQKSLLESASGFLQIIVHHQDPTRLYRIKYPARDRPALRDLDAFLLAIGFGTGFRFFDHADYELEDELIATVAASSPIQTVYQIVKVYTVTGTSPPVSYVRNIIKPVAGISLKIDDTPSALFTVDLTTGLLTVTASLSGGETLKVSGQFDVPVVAERLGRQRTPMTNIHTKADVRLRELKIESSL